MVLDLNRIYIGTFLIFVLYASFLLKLDYLILLTITVLVFYDLYKSKFINNFIELHIFVFFLAFTFFIGINFEFINYINLLFINLIILILVKQNFYQQKLFVILILIFLFNFYEIVSNNRNLFYFIFFISFLNDTSAYVFGKLIRGPLIIPSISPKKTISGTSLSFLFTCLVLFYFNYPLYISILLSISLFIGDIFFSFIKRVNKLKDFSNILKSHGGILDRLDSMFFFIIIMNYYT